VPNAAPASLAAERAAVDAMVRPLQDTLARVSDDLARAERERAAAQAALTEQVRQTALGTDALRDQTGGWSPPAPLGGARPWGGRCATWSIGRMLPMCTSTSRTAPG
jgi:hypothetical protein